MTTREKCPDCKALENGNLELCGSCEAELFRSRTESPSIREYPNVVERLWQDTYADSIADQLDEGRNGKPISGGAIRSMPESISIHDIAREFASKAVDAFRAKFPEWTEVDNA